MRWKKVLLVVTGSLLLVLGVVGIFLPGVPTTGPLLGAAWCYTRSSPRLYHWLINHPVLGRYLKTYLEHRAMPLRAKRWAIGLLWASLTLSSLLLWSWIVAGCLLLVGIGVSWIILRIPTLHLPIEPAESA